MTEVLDLGPKDGARHVGVAAKAVALAGSRCGPEGARSGCHRKKRCCETKKAVRGGNKPQASPEVANPAGALRAAAGRETARGGEPFRNAPPNH